jgi:hypothetical protein
MYFGLALNSCYWNCVVIKNPVTNRFFLLRSFSICLQLKYMKLWKKFHTCFYKLFCLIKLQILCKAKNKHKLALIFKKTKFCVLLFWNLSGSTLPWQIAGHRCYRKKEKKRKNILASRQFKCSFFAIRSQQDKSYCY